MQGSALKYLNTFKKLCGEDFFKNVYLGTTCWDLLENEEMGVQRERELTEPGGFWNPLLKRGSTVVRIPIEPERAKALALQMGSNSASFLKSQCEMSNGTCAEKTSAARTVDPSLDALRREHEERVRKQKTAFARKLREREMAAKADAERERQRQERLLKWQEAERELMLAQRTEAEVKQKRREEAFCKKMKLTQLLEGLQREAERVDLMIERDDRSFALEFEKFSKACDLEIVNRSTDFQFMTPICENCHRSLSDGVYYGRPAFLLRFVGIKN
jgi:hypothetical protein